MALEYSAHQQRTESISNVLNESLSAFERLTGQRRGDEEFSGSLVKNLVTKVKALNGDLLLQ